MSLRRCLSLLFSSLFFLIVILLTHPFRLDSLVLILFLQGNTVKVLYSSQSFYSRSGICEGGFLLPCCGISLF